MEYLTRDNIRKILIVDDSSTARMILKRCFQIAGFTECDYFNAGNGLEALEQIKENPIDLIVTDINMPKMDGINFIKKFKNDNNKDIPIIVISSISESSITIELEKIGISHILTKPLNPQKIIKIFGESE